MNWFQAAAFGYGKANQKSSRQCSPQKIWKGSHFYI